MVIRLTNNCNFHCSHCMMDCSKSKPREPDMEFNTFKMALKFVHDLNMTPIKFVVLSGGECTLSPYLFDYARYAEKHGFGVTLNSNGHWLGDSSVEKEMLSLMALNIPVQVVNIPEYYNDRIDVEKARAYDKMFKNFFFFDTLAGNIVQLGRGKNLPTVRQGPTCVNLRSLTNSGHRLDEALFMVNALKNTGWCSPSIDTDGIIRLGETRFCYPIGDVYSWKGTNVDMANITSLVKNCRCDNCNARRFLSPELLKMIGG